MPSSEYDHFQFRCDFRQIVQLDASNNTNSSRDSRFPLQQQKIRTFRIRRDQDELQKIWEFRAPIVSQHYLPNAFRIALLANLVGTVTGDQVRLESIYGSWVELIFGGCFVYRVVVNSISIHEKLVGPSPESKQMRKWNSIRTQYSQSECWMRLQVYDSPMWIGGSL